MFVECCAGSSFTIAELLIIIHQNVWWVPSNCVITLLIFLPYIMMSRNWPLLCVFWNWNADLLFLQVCLCALVDSLITASIGFCKEGINCSSRPTFQILFYAAISCQIDGWLSNSSSIGRMLSLTSAVMVHSELWVGVLGLILSTYLLCIGNTSFGSVVM